MSKIDYDASFKRSAMRFPKKKHAFEDLGYLPNKCLGCGIDMGECNPRQYCEKTHCPYEFLNLYDDVGNIVIKIKNSKRKGDTNITENKSKKNKK